jgi:hypothetical protein
LKITGFVPEYGVFLWFVQHWARGIAQDVAQVTVRVCWRLTAVMWRRMMPYRVIKQEKITVDNFGKKFHR